MNTSTNHCVTLDQPEMLLYFSRLIYGIETTKKITENSFARPLREGEPRRGSKLDDQEVGEEDDPTKEWILIVENPHNQNPNFYTQEKKGFLNSGKILGDPVVYEDDEFFQVALTKPIPQMYMPINNDLLDFLSQIHPTAKSFKLVAPWNTNDTLPLKEGHLLVLKLGDGFEIYTREPTTTKNNFTPGTPLTDDQITSLTNSLQKIKWRHICAALGFCVG